MADIGTDHGYLPIELVQRGISPKVLACDVRSGPLQRAKEHVAQAGLQHCIETRLSNGFEQILPGEVNGAVIAGMGGMLIRDILLEESTRPKNILKEMKQLILQPQSDWEAVRQTLHSLSFRIDSEKMVIDRDKYYWIFSCTPGQQTFEAQWQYRYGMALPAQKDPTLLQFLQKQLRKNEELLQGLAGGESDAARQRSAALAAEIEELKEVLKAWQ